MIGIATVSVFKEENVLFSSKHNIELLAYDEWSGLLIMPEIIAHSLLLTTLLLPR